MYTAIASILKTTTTPSSLSQTHRRTYDKTGVGRETQSVARDLLVAQHVGADGVEQRAYHLLFRCAAAGHMTVSADF